MSSEQEFNQLVTLYENNKDKIWQDWLKVRTIFSKPGKQGLVGVMESGSHTLVFKISQYINYLIQHELTVMKSLNSIYDYCPHFCRVIGGIICNVDPYTDRKENPFIITCKYPIEKEVLLMEYIDNSYKFYNYIKSPKIPESSLYSTVKQTLLAVSIAQKKRRFCHYDLHSANIMIKKCNKDLVFLYVLDSENQFYVATNGLRPVIIDFGFSYVGNMDNGPVWPSLGHTMVGFTSDRYDPIADPKLFLVTVSGEIDEERHSKRSKKLLNITKNLFFNLNIDWISGWDKDTEKSAAFHVSEILATKTVSSLFNDYNEYCVDIIQTLITLPLQSQEYKNIHTSYEAFLREFSKIENEIGTSFYCLYILKGLVDVARIIRADYVQRESRQHAVDYFRSATYEILDSISKYNRPKDIQFETMLCSLYCLSRCIEGILYHASHKRSREKEKQYQQLPLKTIEEMYAIIDINIEDDYIFNDHTTVIVLDAWEEHSDILELQKEEWENMNTLSSISKGSELYKIYLANK